MKKITGLNDRLKHYEELPPDAELMLPTVRLALLKQIATGKSKQSENTIILFDLGTKIKNAQQESIEIENSDFTVLAEAIRTNGAGYIDHYQAQLLIRLKHWETQNDGPPK